MWVFRPVQLAKIGGMSATEPRSSAWPRKASIVWGPPERLANVMWNGIFFSSPEVSSATWVTGSPTVIVVSVGTLDETGASRATVVAVSDLAPHAVATQASAASSTSDGGAPGRRRPVGTAGGRDGGAWCMTGPFRGRHPDAARAGHRGRGVGHGSRRGPRSVVRFAPGRRYDGRCSATDRAGDAEQVDREAPRSGCCRGMVLIRYKVDQLYPV